MFYLIYLFSTGKEQIQMLMIIALAVTYGVQVLVLFLKGKPHYLLWQIVYILALPLWNIVIPIYSYWHLDDFTWGKTRKIAGVVLTVVPEDVTLAPEIAAPGDAQINQ
jgi:chitin synthase